MLHPPAGLQVLFIDVEGGSEASCGVILRHTRGVHWDGVHEIGVDGGAVTMAFPVAGHRDLQQ